MKLPQLLSLFFSYSSPHARQVVRIGHTVRHGQRKCRSAGDFLAPKRREACEEQKKCCGYAELSGQN